MRKLIDGASTRNVLEIGFGDFVQVDGEWKQVTSNSAYKMESFPLQWFITTSDGGSYSMVDIERYAKAEDFLL